MVRLGTFDPSDLPPGTPAAPELLVPGSHWQLQGNLNGYSRPVGPGLATQAWAGRSLLRPGDLIFFGLPRRCTHVGLHLGSGRYLHSSGRDHGRNGLGVDGLSPADRHPVASHYRRELRGAGRVVRCHDGTTLA